MLFEIREICDVMESYGIYIHWFYNQITPFLLQNCERFIYFRIIFRGFLNILHRYLRKFGEYKYNCKFELNGCAVRLFAAIARFYTLRVICMRFSAVRSRLSLARRSLVARYAMAIRIRLLSSPIRMYLFNS